MATASPVESTAGAWRRRPRSHNTPVKARALLDLDLIRQNRMSTLEVVPSVPVKSLRDLVTRWEFWFLWLTFLALNAGFILFVHNVSVIAAAWRLAALAVRPAASHPA